jgi:Uma2 family endonuclease
VKKLPIYAEHAVQHIWLIDPATQTLEVLRLWEGRWIIAGNYGGDDIVRAEPFEAIELSLSALWIASGAK